MLQEQTFFGNKEIVVSWGLQTYSESIVSIGSKEIIQLPT